ncbi:MAG: V-type ATP synthase subunit I, partial [Clostridia bacterium]|nr:V-type ATP synthase subunit I [Clostridia bacterium]
IFQMRRLLKKKELAEEKEKLFTTEKVSVISGYILSEQTKKLSKEFPDAYISFSEAGDDAPVAFENNPIVSPVEGITESYTMPSGTDIDPNPVMAFFYYIFFGMMFSDAGYGLMMMLVCGYFGFFGKSKIKKMFRMFFFCGISTLFWGLMYGSFFGNAITSIGEIFFNRRLILRPLWINPTAEPLKLLIFSIALGFIQIITGLTIKLFIQVKNGRIKEGIYDTGSWIVTLLGLGIVSAGIGFSPLKAPGAIITLIGVIMLITTQGREKKNIFLKISGGILSLYNITSYISDILSYSRLMALGLATGVIAEVVNILGGLGGNSPAGIIMYCGIFIVGHGLNFAINMLGAYVHTNRLQYVEFYSKFYEGGGKAFIPFGSRY